MVIWKQTSLFAYKEDQTLENIIPTLQLFGEPTPYLLARKAFENFSKTGDLVLDPCCGTGTIGMIGLELGRKVVLSDINQLMIRTATSLFELFNYNRVMVLWEQIQEQIQQGEEADFPMDDPGWARFISSELPDFPAFKRIPSHSKQVQKIFDPADLQLLHKIYLAIQKLDDRGIRELFMVVLYLSLMDSSLLKISRNGENFYIPKNAGPQYPLDVFAGKLELYLIYRSLVRQQVAQNYDWTPRVVQASADQLDYLRAGEVDYIICHLPGVDGYADGEMSYLAELLMGQVTDYQQEIRFELDFRGRYRLVKDMARFLTEMERVLKEKGYLTLIFTGHNVLLTLMVRVAQSQGWDLIPESIEMVHSAHQDDYPVMSMTLQKGKHSTVLGALNKMKVETLYDTEEAILRKIDQYITEHGSGTIEEIQRFLVENYLHDCLIEKPLADLLQENFLCSGKKYWLKPSAEQRELFYQRRVQVLEEEFVEFVREMIYYFLQEAEGPLTYPVLAERLLRMKPRMIFHTPYYRLWMEQCEQEEMELHQLMEKYLSAEKREPFETYDKVIRRLVKQDEIFVEVVQGEALGLTEWSKDEVFKIYLELYEQAKKEQDADRMQRFAQKTLELLDDVTYLEEGKQQKIRSYILRSERV